MKKLVWMVMVAGMAVAAYGQGKVTMNTYAGNSYMKFFTNGVVASGTEFKVGLYYGYGPAVEDITHIAATNLSAAVGNTLPVVGSVSTVGAFNGFVSGASSGGTRVISEADGTTARTTMTYFQIRAWTGNYATYEEALLSGKDTVWVSIPNDRSLGTINQLPPPIVGAIPSVSSAVGATQIPWLVGSTAANPFVLNLVPVPEPSTLALVGLGLVGLIFIRRRK